MIDIPDLKPPLLRYQVYLPLFLQCAGDFHSLDHSIDGHHFRKRNLQRSRRESDNQGVSELFDVCVATQLAHSQPAATPRDAVGQALLTLLAMMIATQGEKALRRAVLRVAGDATKLRSYKYNGEPAAKQLKIYLTKAGGLRDQKGHLDIR